MFEQILIQVFFSHVLSGEPALVASVDSPTLAGTEEIKKPTKDPFAIAPILSARSAIAYDTTTHTVLFQKDAYTRRPMASIGKLVSAMVVLDDHNINETVTISNNAAAQPPTKAWLLTGETLTLSDLIYALLIPSGNDAAVALAEHNAGNEREFIKKLNKKVFDLGLTDTNFSNVAGFDTANHYSTASDILNFTIAAMEYEIIAEAVAKKQHTISSIDGLHTHELENTNHLLGNEHFQFFGVKTGTTPLAGPSLVTRSRNEEGHEIITVILNSESRFHETELMLHWIDQYYKF
jgi:serine-type D-Ala-D-Ala carboxypeptidase (penicillin-binding protein 5/6)